MPTSTWLDIWQMLAKNYIRYVPVNEIVYGLVGVNEVRPSGGVMKSIVLIFSEVTCQHPMAQLVGT